MNQPALDLFDAPLSDEACAEIAEFLYQLASAFEETHLGQILRQHQSISFEALQPPVEDSRQLPLFDPPDDPF